MTPRPFPPVEAVPMEPGSREWAVIADNTKTPAHVFRTYADSLTESEAKFIAAALNHFDALRRHLNERKIFACREGACEIGSHTAECSTAARVLFEADSDAADAADLG